MKKFSFLIILIVIALISANCSPLPQQVMPSDTPSNTPTVTFTATPLPTRTSTPTLTPRPTTTPMSELTPADIGLPFDPTSAHFEVKSCYVYNDTHFHAGDIFSWILAPDQKISIIAPIDGYIENAGFVIPKVGYEINIASNRAYTTDFGTGQVFVDLVHLSGIADDIKPGTFVQQGDIIGHIANGPQNVGRYSNLDIAFRNDPDKYANPEGQGWLKSRGKQYFAFLPFVNDDLSLLDPSLYTNVSPCIGDPYPQQD